MNEDLKTIRSWRTQRKLSLERVCELIESNGFKRPSTAKLSRIERDQEIPLDMLPAFEAIMSIPAKELRPDLAEKFEKIFGGPQ
jgi:transcriptional regulator with XRE-family HTH domain